MIIPAKDVGRIMFEMLEDSIERTMPEASSEEKEESKFRILEAMSRSMFH